MKTLLLVISLFFAITAKAETNPLDLYVRTIYPAESKTVLDAARYLIEHTGYRIEVGSNAPSDARSIALAPIPPVADLRRTMSVKDALLVLIGTENYLVIDKKHKLISFTGNKS